MIGSNPQIELARLHRRFGAVKAVDDVSFSVARGHVFGFIGPNGAGKTTSMRILATLDMPTAGDAYVDGFSVTQDPERVRKRLGFMPDYFETQANILVEEYLDFFARAYGLVGAERLRALRRVLSFTGLDALGEKPVDTLSKGMKQRLCLGRAMVHDPPVMVMDEPAAGLDPRARIQLREMIGQLAAEGKSILVSSHILTELAEMCDTVAIIEQGRLLAVGTVDEIRRARQMQRSVDVRVLADADGLCRWLRERGHTANVHREGDRVEFLHDGDEPAEPSAIEDFARAAFAVGGHAGAAAGQRLDQHIDVGRSAAAQSRDRIHQPFLDGHHLSNRSKDLPCNGNLSGLYGWTDCKCGHPFTDHRRSIRHRANDVGVGTTGIQNPADRQPGNHGNNEPLGQHTADFFEHGIHDLGFHRQHHDVGPEHPIPIRSTRFYPIPLLEMIQSGHIGICHPDALGPTELS